MKVMPIIFVQYLPIPLIKNDFGHILFPVVKQ